MKITEIDRRGFLRGLGAGAATVAGAVQAKNQPHSVPMQNPNVQVLMKWARHYIKNPAELAAFMSECAHESDNFHTLEEYSSGEQYEGRKDLGNTQPGDGPRYKGRGFIQITGKYNYARASDWINQFLNKMGIGKRIDLVRNPELVATPTGGALASIWYWTTFSKNKIKNFNNTRQVTKTINPGLKGERDRENKHQDWQAALNVKIPKPPHPGKPIRIAQR